MPKAVDVVNGVEDWLPGAKFVADVFGLTKVANLVVIGQKILDNPEQREQIITWMRWTQLFSAAPGQEAPAEPSMPQAFADCAEAAIDVRLKIQDSSNE